jgi:uncharacterized membrane protein
VGVVGASTVGVVPHHHEPTHLPGTVARALWVAVGVWVLVVLVGVLLLWPGERTIVSLGDEQRVDGRVESVEVGPCTGTVADDLISCRFLTVRIDEGASAGDRTVLEQAVTGGDRKEPQVGDRLVLVETVNPDGSRSYNFADYQRTGPLLALAAVFVGCVVLLGRWRGVGALAGLAISVAVLVVFLLPALLDGAPPVLAAIVAASLIAVASLYLAHGISPATNVALLSTLLALALTGVLAWLFVGLTSITGFTDENSFLLEGLGVSIDPRGLLLAGVVIGSLGVLDDVTVTQVAAVGELHRAQPGLGPADLYRSAVHIGRDHISSVVNTLFLAYAGAALPLLLLFTQTGLGVGDVSTREVVAVEIVRTLVGSIGLIAAVPIATGLAALVIGGRRDDEHQDDREPEQDHEPEH